MLEKPFVMIGLVVAAWALSVPPATAQSGQNFWRGRINCAKLSFARSPQRVPMTLTVSGNAATYTHRVRVVYSRNNSPAVGTEVGSGTVAADGAITLSAMWTATGANPRLTYTASYSGRMHPDTAELQGGQVWSYDGKTENRSCSIRLNR
jgi:hypothetical protein